ncbi:CHAP domain-containing protein [Candidatus Parcubacteria bacterium]|nr:CHAP domain-containing protein [Candidatus Parcubacteria bacterium]
MTILLFQGSASSNNTISQRTVGRNNNSYTEVETNKTNSNHRQSILPPFKSEMDIAVAQSSSSAVSSGNYFSASSAGNTYYRGYCTWYAKSKRPDLPNSLGNANTWYSRAQALGLPTGSVPKPGAIGQQGMHVVYVEKVNGDGTIFVSEMNYRGFGVVSHRTVPASTFQYIY